MARRRELVIAVADTQADAIRARRPDTELGSAVAGREGTERALEGVGR